MDGCHILFGFLGSLSHYFTFLPAFLDHFSINRHLNPCLDICFLENLKTKEHYLPIIAERSEDTAAKIKLSVLVSVRNIICNLEIGKMSYSVFSQCSPGLDLLSTGPFHNTVGAGVVCKLLSRRDQIIFVK